MLRNDILETAGGGYNPAHSRNTRARAWAAMNKRAQMAGIVGMDEDRVRALFGEPSQVLEYPDVRTLEYEQIPGYWFSSNFQVFFKSGVVYGVEPNDD